MQWSFKCTCHFQSSHLSLDSCFSPRQEEGAWWQGRFFFFPHENDLFMWSNIQIIWWYNVLVIQWSYDDKLIQCLMDGVLHKNYFYPFPEKMFMVLGVPRKYEFKFASSKWVYFLLTVLVLVPFDIKFHFADVLNELSVNEKFLLHFKVQCLASVAPLGWNSSLQQQSRHFEMT